MSFLRHLEEEKSPLLSKPMMAKRLGSMSFNINRFTPLVHKLIEESISNDITVSKFKFGVKDVVNNEIFENKNVKKKKKIDEEYKIDVSHYPPTKHQLQLRELRKQLDRMNEYNDREMRKIKRMRRVKRAKVVIKKMNFLSGFIVQQEEVKKEPSRSPSKSRKAPLSVSHGGPTTILKKTCAFVEKNKLHSLLNMNIIFENINKLKKDVPNSMTRSSNMTR